MFEASRGKLNIGICDDLKSDIEKLEIYLIRIFQFPEFVNIEYEITAHYSNGKEALDSEIEHDILFLDVEMPGGIDGFKTAKQLQDRHKKPIIIFLTMHDARGAEALPVGGFRFLSKNFNEKAFVEAMIASTNRIHTNQRIKVQYKDKFGEEAIEELIYTNDITHIETDGKNSIIYTKYEKTPSNKSLKYWKELLPKNRFYRVQTSYLVNFVNVIDIDVKKRLAYLECNVEGNEKIQIARDKAKAAFEAMHDFLRFWSGGVE